MLKKVRGYVIHTTDYQDSSRILNVLTEDGVIGIISKGCKNFVILQPFGCLPNHVIGRGICKKLKEMFPDIELLPLDYDPDVSFANIENRLQMLIMNQKTSDPRSEIKEVIDNREVRSA